MAWYQRTYFSLKNLDLINFFKKIGYSFIIGVMIFYLNYLDSCKFVECSPLNGGVFLKSYRFNNNWIFTSNSISYITSCDVMYNIFKNVDCTNFYQIAKYNDVFGTKLPYRHPWSHPHLNILNFNNLVNNVYVNIQMSTDNFNNCTYLSEKNILGKNNQWIANNFYLYSLDDVLYNNYHEGKSKTFIETNFKNINDHVNLVINSYKKK